MNTSTKKLWMYAAFFLPILTGGAIGQSTPTVIPVPVPIEFPPKLVIADVLAFTLATDFTIVVEYDQGGDSFTVVWRERVPGGSVYSPWYENQFTVSITFRVTDISIREGGNEIYVAGMRGNGDGVINRFNFQRRTTGLEVVGQQIAVLPRGTSMPNHNVTQELVGATWTVPTLADYGVPTRSFVLGDTVGIPRAIAVDPFGRYLLILSDDTSKLYLMDLLASPNVIELLSGPSSIPALAQTDDITIYTANSGGHVVVIHDSLSFIHQAPADPMIVMLDSENTGIFESIVHVGDGIGDLESAGYSHHDIEPIWVVSGVADW